jgi:hypothetical protein
MKTKTLLLAATLLALPVTGALAQKTTYAQRHSIRARQASQQARIDHGVRDGQITPRGAAAAEKNQAHIASEEHADRAADGGHLTAQDRHQLARQQDRASKGIYDRNHNQYTDPGVTPK